MDFTHPVWKFHVKGLVDYAVLCLSHRVADSLNKLSRKSNEGNDSLKS